MNKTNLLLSGFLLLCSITAYSQNYYTPKSQLVIYKSDISKKTAIANKIKTGEGQYRSNEIEDMLFEVNLNNKKVQRAIDGNHKKITDLLDLKSQLHSMAGVDEMRKQLAEKKKARKEIKHELEKALQQISYYGYFATIVSYTQKEYYGITNTKLKERGRAKLASKAIEKLNGTFISSLTKVQDGVALRDYIKAEVSGSMTIYGEDIEKRIVGNKFLWVCGVSVAPLAKEKQLGSSGGSSSIVTVIDLAGDYNYRKKLLSAGVLQSEINKIDRFLESEKPGIENKNRASNNDKDRIITNYTKKFNKLNVEIVDLQYRVNNSSKMLKEYITQKTNITYNAYDIKGTVNKALKYFDSKIEKYKQKIRDTKEYELIDKQGSVTLTDDPAGETAVKVIGLCNLVTTNSTIDNFKELTEVESGLTINYEKDKSVTVYREIEKIWIYLDQKGPNSTDITIVAKFKITGIKKGGGGDDKYTSGNDLPGSGNFTDSRDNKTYKWVKIGDQVWMAENLNYKTYSGSWCYDNKTSNCYKYGRLYNWETAKKSCPVGWHLPTDDEWKTLEGSLGMTVAEQNKKGYRGTNEGSKMADHFADKSWRAGSLTNDAGFGNSGLDIGPSGYRFTDGNYYSRGNFTYVWSSTGSGTPAWRRHLNYSNTKVDRNTDSKAYGFSVRCIKD